MQPLIDSDPIFKRIGRNTSFNVLRGLIVLPATLILTPIVLRYAGIEAYGIWALLKSFVAYSMLVDLGMSRTVTKYAAEYAAREDHPRINRIFNTYLVIYAVLGLVLLGITYLIKGWIISTFFRSQTVAPHDLEWMLLMTMAVLAFTLVIGVYRAFLNGMQRMDISGMIGTFIIVASFFASAMFLILGWGIFGLVLADGLSVIAGLFIYILACHKLMPFFRVNPLLFRFSELRRVFRFNALSAGQVALGIVHYQLDKLIISFFLGLQLLAYYEIAFRLVSMIAAPFGALVEAVIPAASGTFAKNRSEGTGIGEIFHTIQDLTSLVAPPIYLFVLAFSSQIITLWIGAGNELAILALRFLCIVYLIGSLTSPADAILSGIGRLEPATFSALLTAILSVTLSLSLVRPWGLKGVLVGAVIARIVGAAVFFFSFGKVTKTQPISRVLFVSLRVPLSLGILLVVPIYFIASQFPNSAGQLIVATLSFPTLYCLSSIAFGKHFPVLKLLPFSRYGQ